MNERTLMFHVVVIKNPERTKLRYKLSIEAAIKLLYEWQAVKVLYYVQDTSKPLRTSFLWFITASNHVFTYLTSNATQI